jgi:TPR repeat protein
MKRVEANDAGAIYMLGNSYHHGLNGFQQDQTKAIELYNRAADLGSSEAHNFLGNIYRGGGDVKKAKFHYEAAAMAGNEMARLALGTMEYNDGNMERAVKHLMISASAGCYVSMQRLKICFEKGLVSSESINSALIAYNNACAEMRSKARNACIRIMML